MRYFLFLLLFVTLVCGAAVYMQVDKNGGVSYSDNPSENATVVNVPQINTVSTPQPPVLKKIKNANTANQEAPPLGPTKHVDYSDFSITSPQDQQTFQNERDIPVEVNLVPALQLNDTIQLYVDGKKYRDPWATPHLEIYLLDRGQHTVSADLLDDHGIAVLHSNTVTIFVHYHSIGGGD
jgi:hypothetical protein